jgi:hypothetical protein
MKRIFYFLALATLAWTCSSKQDDKQANSAEANDNNQYANAPKQNKKMKKYTNDDFYEDGKLSAEKTLAAYREMFDHYNYPVDDWLLEHMFISDFGLGDFVNVGMGGVFWVNDPVAGYFGHEIFLLPGQMIVEHKHVKTEYPAKMESWHVRHGIAYNFGEVGESEGMPVLPASQNGHITVDKYVKTNRGNITTLNRAEAPHFMMGGPEGCIVSEYANYHDGNGLRFTNPNVVFADVLGNN